MERVLLITEQTDFAADLVVLAIRELGGDLVRLNLDTFPSEVALSWEPSTPLSLCVDGARWTASDFGSAWFRRFPTSFATSDAHETWVGDFIDRESRCFLEGYWEADGQWRWMNHPWHVRRAESKLAQLRVAQEVGFKIPSTLVTNDPTRARAFVQTRPSVGKVISSAGIDKASQKMVAFSREISPAELHRDEPVRSSPLILQDLIPNKLDIRVTVAGERLFATEIRLMKDHPIDWRAHSPDSVTYAEHELPVRLRSSALALLRRLGLSFGALDLVRDPGGDYYFLEVNPSGQWGWLEKKTGQRISEAIARYLCGLA